MHNKTARSLFLLLLLTTKGWAAPPNVIVIVADDLGWSDGGYHGNEVIQTPSLDRLAAEGVQLDRFYTTPICSPTRAGLMTGRDPMRLGIVYGVIMACTPPACIRRKLFCPSCSWMRVIRRQW